AWPKPDFAEHRLGRRLPHARLIAQALIFVRVSRMDIAVGVDLARLSRQSPVPHAEPIALYREPKAAVRRSKGSHAIFCRKTGGKGPDGASRRDPRHHRRGASVHAGYASFGQGDVSTHDELRVARLGHRQGARLSLPADASRHGEAMACDAANAARSV